MLVDFKFSRICSIFWPKKMLVHFEKIMVHCFDQSCIFHKKKVNNVLFNQKKLVLSSEKMTNFDFFTEKNLGWLPEIKKWQNKSWFTFLTSQNNIFQKKNQPWFFFATILIDFFNQTKKFFSLFFQPIFKNVNNKIGQNTGISNIRQNGAFTDNLS